MQKAVESLTKKTNGAYDIYCLFFFIAVRGDLHVNNTFDIDTGIFFSI